MWQYFRGGITEKRITSMGPTLYAALVPLDHPDYYFHWHFIEISAANAIVIGLMLVTFVAALLLPFPGRRRRKQNQ